MGFKKTLQSLLVTSVALASIVEESRQLSTSPAYRGNNNPGYNSLQHFHDNNFIDRNLHENQVLSDYDRYYNEIETDYSAYSRLAEKSDLNFADKSSAEHSPALSALTLLGFLYFLNYIQDVLEGDSGRKKRAATIPLSNSDRIGNYLTSIETVIKKLIESMPESEVKGRDLSDSFDHFNQDTTDVSNEQRAFRIVSFITDLFRKIPELFGFGRRKALSRYDSVVESSPPSQGFWSLFGNRIGLIARITNFLNDPHPSKIGRANEPEIERRDFTAGEEYAQPTELSDEDKLFLPSYARRQDLYRQKRFTEDETDLKRQKRFTKDEMNVWYSKGGDTGHHATSDESSYDVNSHLMGMVMSLFKQAIS